jgi:protein SCO1/2
MDVANWIQVRGPDLAVNFIFVSCSTNRPILTAEVATVQDPDRDFGSKVALLSITADPEDDTPNVLQRYAGAFGADLVGWKFLTGSPKAIQDGKRRYGVFAAKTFEWDAGLNESDVAARSAWHAARTASRRAL